MYFRNYVNVGALFAALSTLSNAAPPALTPLDVFDPHIISPNADTVWKVLSHVNVTWDTSDAPQNITNPIGMVQLFTNGENTGPTLAAGFDILDASVEVQVPDVAPGSDYQIVLFGDSGNISPFFKIVGS